MKKLLKVLGTLICIFALVAGITFLIDASRAASDKTPLCALQIGEVINGTTREYYGLGYKVIAFHQVNGFSKVKIGSWLMKISDFDEEIAEYFKESTPEETVTPFVPEPTPIEELIESGEETEESGEIVVSGEQTISGELIETSGEVVETSGENEGISGEVSIPSGEVEKTNEEAVVSGESGESSGKEEASNEEIVEKPTAKFKAIITGINQNTIIVMVDDGENVEDGKDLFTFTNPTETTFTKGQKVLVEYTGIASESYPAKITVTNLTVIE